jgi:hypothetical protein
MSSNLLEEILDKVSGERGCPPLAVGDREVVRAANGKRMDARHRLFLHQGRDIVILSLLKSASGSGNTAAVMTNRGTTAPLLLVILLFLAQSLAAQEASDKPATAKAAVLLDQAQAYDIRLDGAAKPLLLKPEPIFNWTNPERLQHKGTVYVWLVDNRPQVIGSLFTYELRDQVFEKHAFHSLADRPLESKFADRLAWKPLEAGLRWQPLDGPELATNSRQRQSQMRQLARDFKCTLIDPKLGPTELRFLPKPIYEYAAPEAKVLDGAIFAFVIATDPEALLVMEATDRGWRYAFARFHYWELHAEREGKEVWKVAADDQMHNRLGDAKFLHRTYNSYGVGQPRLVSEAPAP